MTQYDQRLPKHLQRSFLVSTDTHFHMRVAEKQRHKMFFCFPRNLDWCNKFHSSITPYTTTKVIMVIPHHHLCPHKSSVCGSSSMAWLLQVCSLYITFQWTWGHYWGRCTLVVYMSEHTCKRGAVAQYQVQGSHAPTQLPDSYLHQLSNHSLLGLGQMVKAQNISAQW